MITFKEFIKQLREDDRYESSPQNPTIKQLVVPKPPPTDQSPKRSTTALKAKQAIKTTVVAKATGE